MEKQMTLQYNNDGNPVEITLRRASVKTGIKRYTLMSAADELNRKEETDPILATIRLFTFPTVVCGTVEVKGLPWPMELEEFMELDEILVDKWLDAIYTLNPHWKGLSNDKESEDVKVKK